MKRWNYHRPKFTGRAALKTLLRRNGFKIKRDFYGPGYCIAQRNGKQWRFRFDDGVVDVSCDLWDFDRWANSTDRILNLEELKAKLK